LKLITSEDATNTCFVNISTTVAMCKLFWPILVQLTFHQNHAVLQITNLVWHHPSTATLKWQWEVYSWRWLARLFRFSAFLFFKTSDSFSPWIPSVCIRLACVIRNCLESVIRGSLQGILSCSSEVHGDRKSRFTQSTEPK
jgi:hypothetical protein